MFNSENELIMLKEWATGKHREDIPLFEKKLFDYDKLFEDIRDGASIGQLSVNFSSGKYKELTTISDLLGMEGSSTFYYGARAVALNEQRKLYFHRIETEPENAQYLFSKMAEITDVIDGKENTSRSSDFADLFLEELAERQNESNPKYGFKELDEDTKGLHRGHLTVLAARPGCGKSNFALQITNRVIDAGYKVMYLPLEMTEYETFQRMIIQQQVVYNSNEAENPTEEQKEGIRTFLTNLEKSGLFSMYCGLCSMASIKKKIQEEKPFLVVVDQLTQVEPMGKAQNVRDKYIQITSELKQIALSEHVCVFALHQLNRDADEKENLTLANLAESDSVGRDADEVFAIKTTKEKDNEEDEYVSDSENLKEATLVIVKNRHGKQGRKIHLVFEGERVTFWRKEPEPKPTLTKRQAAKRIHR